VTWFTRPDGQTRYLVHLTGEPAIPEPPVWVEKAADWLDEHFVALGDALVLALLLGVLCALVAVSV